MRTLTALAAFLLLTGLTRGVEDQIQRIASEIDSTVGVAALHIESGRRIAVRADEQFPMGSVNKLPIALAFMRQVDSGRFSLSSEVTIQPSDFATGHSPIRDAARGRAVTMSVGRLLEMMLGESDNTAAEVILKLAGGPGAVEDRVTTTPAEMLLVLEQFYRGDKGLSKSSHDRLMRIMTRSQSGGRRIKAGAPARAVVAGKTGTLPGTVNDVAIITSPNGRDHVLIVVFTKGGRSSTMNQRERAVAEITREVYRHLIGWAPARSKRD
jgi:beta-lactamase class A